MIYENKPIKAEKLESGKAELEETPPLRTPKEVKEVRKADDNTRGSGDIAEIKDISAEINADILLGANAEKKQKTLDTENEIDFEVIEDEDYQEEESESYLVPIVLLCGVALGASYFLLRNKLPNTDALQFSSHEEVTQ